MRHQILQPEFAFKHCDSEAGALSFTFISQYTKQIKNTKQQITVQFQKFMQKLKLKICQDCEAWKNKQCFTEW